MLRNALINMRFRDRAEFAERWHCRLNMHRIYLSKGPVSPITGRDRVLSWVGSIPAQMFDAEDAHHAAVMVDDRKIRISFNKDTVALLCALDGVTPNGVLIDSLGLDEQALADDDPKVRNTVPLRIVDSRPATD